MRIVFKECIVHNLNLSGQSIASDDLSFFPFQDVSLRHVLDTLALNVVLFDETLNECVLLAVHLLLHKRVSVVDCQFDGARHLDALLDSSFTSDLRDSSQEEFLRLVEQHLHLLEWDD